MNCLVKCINEVQIWDWVYRLILLASYALLPHLVAHVTGRKPGEFILTIGDAHVYLNHVDALKEQMERMPRPFPKLVIRSGYEEEEESIWKGKMDWKRRV
jgi:thymidylate synthase